MPTGADSYYKIFFYKKEKKEKKEQNWSPVGDRSIHQHRANPSQGTIAFCSPTAERTSRGLPWPLYGRHPRHPAAQGKKSGPRAHSLGEMRQQSHKNKELWMRNGVTEAGCFQARSVERDVARFFFLSDFPTLTGEAVPFCKVVMCVCVCVCAYPQSKLQA